jgi:hypothetical protein
MTGVELDIAIGSKDMNKRVTYCHKDENNRRCALWFAALSKRKDDAEREKAEKEN